MQLGLMFIVPSSGVPDCAHASPSLPRGQQHDHAAPLLRWNLPVLGLVPSQSQWEDSERPFCLHGCLSPVCECYIPCLIQYFQLYSVCLHLFFYLWCFLSPVHGADTDGVMRCRHLAGEGYSYSQGGRVFQVLEWTSLESNVTLPGLSFCHIGCSHRLCNYQHCQRGTIW